ncbi:MAG TPA: Gfo/Idh/MocA family oxidoreductase [Planctomycetota bacterium]|nr:Gfo/Idh/MocA family oxidoreductase [Planctomycetota bacterium]HRR80209.1 Gfo/Idh/MocA family oxidoreductase [Planctomycetota bacterium]HRT93199.1 Gfo/Idh/MocA family oxidoreductase [Planctomycetota bacterium]
MKPVRIGIVGLGWWACETHIPNLLRVEGAQVAALCSRSPASIERGRKALAGRAPEPLVFDDYERLLGSDAVDAVVISTPNHLHAPMALAALWAGKHVLVEKPLGLDPAECQPIVAEAAERRLTVQVGVELRYSEMAQTLRRLIRQGAIGEPALLRTDIWRQWGAPGSWRVDVAQSGGLFHELGVHYIDLLCFLAGKPLQWVAATGGAKATGRDLDYAITTLGFEGGAVAAFGMCLFAAGARDEIAVEAIGTEGRLAGDIIGGKVALWRGRGEPQEYTLKRAADKVFGFPGSLESVASFVECVRTGGAPSADAQVGADLCRICEAARHSIAAGGEKMKT